MSRILVLVDKPGNQRVLGHWLMQVHEVITRTSREGLEGLGEVDLIVTDPLALNQHREALRALRIGVRPLFLPVVLLLTRGEAEQAPTSLWEEVDDVLISPVLKPELHGRLATLLRTRELSLLAHAELSQIFDSSSNAMCVIGPDRMVRRVNRAFTDFVTKNSRTLEGQSLQDVLQPDSFDEIDDVVGCVLGGDEACSCEIELEVERLGKRAFQLTASPFRGLKEDLLGVILDLTDITALKESESSLQDSNTLLEGAVAELQTIQGHLVHKERLHALGQMASGVVHDFNNTLSVIIGYAEMLLRDSKESLDEDSQKSLTAIATAARDAAYIVKGLRGFYKSRNADDSRTLLSLNDVIEEGIRLTRPRWHDEAQGRDAPISITRRFGRLPRLMGNEAELREALTNLIFNAVDAMPEGGEIIFSTHRDEDVAVLEVEDTGVGMDEETARQSLEPFFTTKGEGGTGLGLAMVFGIISRHRGVMFVSSEPGQGTKITLRFPLGKEEAPSVESERATTVSVPSLRLLVVDDHPAVRESFRSQLARDGHDVTLAEDGITGLDAFQEGEFDAVITDRSMPNLDGLRMAAVIKATSPETPVIMITGQDIDEEARTPTNVDTLLHKPVPLSDLQRALARAAKAQTSSD